MFERILVGSDLTATSEPAIRAAVRLAREQRASMIVAHLNERSHQADKWLVPLFEDELNLYATAIKREEEAARKLLERIVAEAVGSTPLEGGVEVIVAPGRAAEGIVELAIRRGVDLIVVGTHGRSGTVGSVAERVVRTAHRPVLVMPA